ncbi:hypothetical protein [Planomonospora venezuelensis]|uniref:Uncharacterized protein n=1 Tax=Planomonospora venezuelensis TaxID=1999 RepID=A0A841D9J3_PLAVE|nr:hypothetical protein [Planomonospora venezuelensis]MBB5967292.1 hypothetical protein [Planomonospora venezuelensis]GIM98553.1 hypothetical protein Pve01_02120 [Planomonospora venezuelensis]
MALLANPLTLLIALVLAGPALWHAFILEDLDIATALIRYLAAVVVSALMLGVLRRITSSYGPPDEPEDGAKTNGGPMVTTVSVDRIPAESRRATDRADAPAPAIAGELTAGEPPVGENAALPSAAAPAG